METPKQDEAQWTPVHQVQIEQLSTIRPLAEKTQLHELYKIKNNNLTNVTFYIYYEAEQERLLRLLEEVSSDDDIEMEAESSEHDEDFLEAQSEASDKEQNASSSGSDDEDTEPMRGRLPCFRAHDKTVWWKHSLEPKMRKTRRENIVIHVPGVTQSAKQAKSPMK
ncbi:hypothetical protein NQ314_015723 [Rhamnusium bicolor]|uniref:Uncharacterized protein n=1 Tax=Rhamnusium bicolor TaxID=1586634 RepID=A0AAV8WXZ3_9CUCU|nr:hypothetical protein NQ314_015723 [Rhamnusium bicolor]